MIDLKASSAKWSEMSLRALARTKNTKKGKNLNGSLGIVLEISWSRFDDGYPTRVSSPGDVFL